jgi:hypothetical protein
MRPSTMDPNKYLRERQTKRNKKPPTPNKDEERG